MGLHGDGLGGVNAEADILVGNAQTIELRGFGSGFREVEAAVFAQFHRIDGYRSVETDVLEIEHRVLCLRDVALNVEFLLVAGRERQHGNPCNYRLGNNLFHPYSFLFWCKDSFIFWCKDSANGGNIKKKVVFFLCHYFFNHYLCTIFPTNTVNKDET